MTTVEALKELFTALGGSEEDVKAITTNPEMVHAIAEVASGAIELPKVTAADAGDILAVDESGKWAKAELSGGGNIYEYFSINEDTGALQDGKKFSDILSSLSAGKVVILRSAYGRYMFNGQSNDGFYYFEGFMINAGSTTKYYWKIFTFSGSSTSATTPTYKQSIQIA